MYYICRVRRCKYSDILDKFDNKLNILGKFILNLNKEIGERLKEARFEMGIDQVDMANKIGISRSLLAGYELGGKISDKTIFKIKQNTNINIDWLINRVNRQVLDLVFRADIDQK